MMKIYKNCFQSKGFDMDVLWLGSGKFLITVFKPQNFVTIDDFLDLQNFQIVKIFQY